MVVSSRGNGAGGCAASGARATEITTSSVRTMRRSVRGAGWAGSGWTGWAFDRPGLPAPPALPALEQELRRELHLTRRSGVAGREARGRDQAECCAARDGDSARQSEVGMIEQVEHLDAELHAGLPGEL